MKVVTLSLLLGIVIATVNGKTVDVLRKNSGSRILGGSPAAVGQFPWQAIIYMEFSPTSISFGGASLISSTRLLTAAHNWFNGNTYATKMTVHLGTNTLEGGLVIDASNVIVHEEFNSSTVKHDIAVIVLPYAVEFNEYIQAVALPFGAYANDDFAGANAVTSGFGANGEGSLTGELNFVDVSIITNQECVQELGIIGMFVESSNICSSGRGNVGICSGDSGGPLVVYRDNKAVLIGIPSFRLSTCGGETPSVYTRVTSYESWIESKL